MEIKVNNTPAYAVNYEWIVAREIANEFWFYGAYNESERASQVANEINGIAIASSLVEPL